MAVPYWLIVGVFSIGILYFVIFWIRMFIDCIKREFPNPSEKVVWILVLIFLGMVGAFVYHIVVKKNDKKI
jgi:hypothetical protein